MRLDELLGIEYPFIQGGMANIATGEFAAAVSNAGGLGLIGSGGYDAARIEQEIYDARKATDKPFGVNLMLLNPDVDNIAKSILDAMNGFVFKDDNQVSKISVEKKFAENEKVFVRVIEY